MELGATDGDVENSADCIGGVAVTVGVVPPPEWTSTSPCALFASLLEDVISPISSSEGSPEVPIGDRVGVVNRRVGAGG